MATYPVRVDAALSPQLSRGLWLVKWLLAIPHFVVLAFLWVAFVVVSIVAFFAILLTGRYPRALFDFNLGVLRWTWRVAYYSYGALGTDRYPPFSLADVPDYPAHLDVAYPEQLSRGLVLVKWWLLAIPHYLLVGVFLGGAWGAREDGRAPGLVQLLVFFAAVVLLFTGRYPRPIFDFVLGLNRWVLRVAAYAALMTDAYPPFRLDMGEADPEPPTAPTTEAAPEQPPVAGARGWTAGRIVSLVLGSLLVLVSLGLLAGGGVLTWLDNTQRDSDNYLTSGSHRFSTGSYALTTEDIDLGEGADWVTPQDILGTVRLRVTATDPTDEVFVGVARQDDADSYLAGVSHEVVDSWSEGRTHYRQHAGTAPTTAPTDTAIWVAQASGAGRQTLTWKPGSGHWVVVVMNPDASPGVSIRADAAATVPDLDVAAAALFASGAVLLVIGIALVTVPVVLAGRRRA